MNPLRMAVVGAGHLGKIHARLLRGQPDVELVGVVDPLAEARQAVADELGVATFAHHRELPANLDGAVVATTTRTHHTVATDLLNRRVHLLVEKPLAASLAEAESLETLATRQGCVLQVGHVERFNPGFQSAVPHLGDPLFLEAVRSSTYTGRSIDVGVVHDLMIHDLDLVMCLVPADVVSVQAFGWAVLGPHEDIAQARLQFANGCVANLKASRASYLAERRLDVFSERSFASIDFSTGNARIVRPSEKVRNHTIAVQELNAQQKIYLKEHLFDEFLPTEDLHVEKRNAIQEEHSDFAASIRLGCEPRVTGAHACDVLAVCEQIVSDILAFRESHGNLPPCWRETVIPATIPHPRTANSVSRASVARRRKAG